MILAGITPSYLSILGGIMVGAFIISQVLYFVPNLFIWLVLHRVRPQYVDKSHPEKNSDVKVIIPVYKERQSLVEGTIRNIIDSDYPSENIDIYVVYEADDPVVSQYVDELNAIPIAVDRDSPVCEWISSFWGTGAMPKNKASALNYAIYTLDIEPDDTIAVFDSDTRFPPDLIRRGVAGLDTHEIVQAKQTVRNLEDGILPLMESMGMAAWCDSMYAKSYEEPYQLLGKGYFIKHSTLSKLVGWNLSDTTEDMALGVLAAERGYRLGVLDTYVEDLCPATPRDWIRQKRRWVSGPYRILERHDLGLRDSIGFQTYTIGNQVIAVTNIIGVPSGVFALGLFITGNMPALPHIVWILIMFNLFSWIYYSVLTVRSAHRAVSYGEYGRVKYWIMNNPITQIFYSTMWSIPILLAIYDLISGRESTFEVTPK